MLLGLLFAFFYGHDLPCALLVSLGLGPAALQVRPKLRVLLVAHHAWLALAVQLLDVVGVLHGLALPECPYDHFGVVIAGVRFVAPDHLNSSVVLHNALRHEALITSLNY